jgi:hypothetical protein
VLLSAWRGQWVGLLEMAGPVVLSVGLVAACAGPALARGTRRSHPYLRGAVAGTGIVLCGMLVGAPVAGYFSVGPSLRDTAKMAVLLAWGAFHLSPILGALAGVAFARLILLRDGT